MGTKSTSDVEAASQMSKLGGSTTFYVGCHSYDWEKVNIHLVFGVMNIKKLKVYAVRLAKNWELLKFLSIKEKFGRRVTKKLHQKNKNWQSLRKSIFIWRRHEYQKLKVYIVRLPKKLRSLEFD